MAHAYCRTDPTHTEQNATASGKFALLKPTPIIAWGCVYG